LGGVLVQHLLLSRGEQLLLDSNAFIYFLDGEEPYYGVLLPLFRRVQAGELSMIVSTITEAELLVRPERDGNEAARERIEDLLSEHGIFVVGVDRKIARRAAVIRAKTRMKLPDAIIVATALETDCDAIVGNDGKWEEKDVEIPFIRLGDVVKE
jgi:predicted nucleic acid-binding protein